MENMNLGIVKAIISNKISNEFLNESSISSSVANSKTHIGKFTNILTNSPVLMLEYEMINNIENKHIKSELLASKFIDENVKIFSTYSKSDVEVANKMLNQFEFENGVESIPSDVKKLYESINTLIYETVNEDTNINVKQEAYSNILTYLTHNVNESEEKNISIELVEGIDLDSVIEIATNKFNDKFNSLTEDEKEVLTTVVYGNNNNKTNLFESLKTESLELLNHTKTEGIEDKVHEGISMVNKMEFTDENIIKLFNLKSSLG